MLKENSKAPDFELKNQNGETVKLSDFLGELLILYFYPKDDTPGCTTEACNFRDDYSKYDQLGIKIIGISPDSQKSHEKFMAKYELPFTLLSDEDHQVVKNYGVWGKKKFMGREYDGILRTTFVIDREGKVVKVFEGVKPATHSEEVLNVVKGLD